MKKILVIFFAALLCLVNAQRGPGGGDMHVDPSPRNSTCAEFDSTFQSSNLDGRLKFRLVVEANEVRIDLKAFSSVGHEQAGYRVRIGFTEIVEYNEVNNEAGFQPGNDTAVSSLKLTSLQYSPINCSQAQSEATLYVCEIRSTDGQLKITAFITSATSNSSGIPQKPTSVKFNVEINLTNRHVGSRIALVTNIRTGEGLNPHVRDHSQEQDDGFAKHPEHELVAGEGSVSWATFADQNGVNITVINSGPVFINPSTNQGPVPPNTSGSPVPLPSPDDSAREEAVQLIFSFDTTVAGTIVWDPKLLFSGSFASSGNFAAPAVALVTLALMLLSL